MAESNLKDLKDVPGLRRFMVFTQPHPLDPKWEHPVVEIDVSTEPPTNIEYEDIVVLEQIMLSLGRDRARSAGFNAGAKTVLDAFGLTPADYVNRRKANKAAKQKNPLDNPAQPAVESRNDA